MKENRHAIFYLYLLGPGKRVSTVQRGYWCFAEGVLATLQKPSLSVFPDLDALLFDSWHGVLKVF